MGISAFRSGGRSVWSRSEALGNFKISLVRPTPFTPLDCILDKKLSPYIHVSYPQYQSIAGRLHFLYMLDG